MSDLPDPGEASWLGAGETLDRAGLGLLVVREGGRIEACNSTLGALLGLAPEDVVGRSCFDLANEEDAAALAAALASGESRIRIGARYRTGSDADLPTRTTITPLEAGLFFLAIEDRSESLRENEAHYREFFLKAAIGMGISDARGNLVDFNEAMLEQSGFRREEALAIGSVARLYADPEDRDRALGLLRANGHLDRFPARFVHQDGGTWDALMSLRPVTIDGQPYHLATIEDVTEKKRIEAERRELEERLAEAKRLDTAGRLAAGVAHDLNNLLQAISGNASLAASAGGERVRTFLERIQRAVDRAGHLAAQLLVFGREAPLSLQPLEVARVLREVAEDLEPVLGEGVALRLPRPDPALGAMADGAGLFHLLLNLCFNARDAIQAARRQGLRESGVIAIMVEPVRAVPRTRESHSGGGAAPGDYIRFTVADDGVGMDRPTRERMFEPFFTTKEPGHGSGLGLATAYGLLRQHGGWIDVESRPGEGTRVAFHIPAAAIPAPCPGPRHGPAADGSGRVVLLAEDEPMVREMTREVLESSGYEVLEAEDGERALALFERDRKRIDVVVLDLMMPGIPGDQAIGRLLEIDPAARIVVVTGCLEGGSVRGTASVLRKPFRMGDLLRSMDEALGRG